MARVKSGPYRRRRHQRLIAHNSGYEGSYNHLFKRANEAYLHAQWYAYNDRRNRKRDLRRLWIARINAACRMNDMSYSTFMHGLKLAEVNVNRKMLSEIAIADPEGFKALTDLAKEQLAK